MGQMGVPFFEYDAKHIKIITDSAKILFAGRDISASISAILHMLLVYFKCNRAYIFEVDWDAGTFSNTHEETAQDVSKEIDNLQNLPIYLMDVWIKSFETQAFLHIPDVQALNAEGRADYQTLADQGIKELYATPFYFNDKLCGFLGVDDPAENKDDVAALQTLSYFIFSEMDKERSHALTSSAVEKYETLMENIHGGLAITELDEKTGRIKMVFCNKGFADMLGIPESETYDIYSKDAYAGIHPDDKDAVVTEFLRAYREQRKFSYTYRLGNGRGGYKWVSANASSIPDKNGKTTFYMLFTDASEEKAREQRYKSEIALMEQASAEDTIFAMRYNVTRDVLEALTFAPEDSKRYINAGFNELLDKFAKAAIGEEQQETFRSMFSRNAMLQAYMDAKNSVEYEHQRRLENGKIVWARACSKLLKQPFTEDVIAFCSIKDVNDEHISKEMLSYVVKSDYDYLVYLDAKDGRYLFFSSIDSPMVKPPNPSLKYEEAFAEYMRQLVCEDDVEYTLRSMSLATVLKELEQSDTYRFTTRIKRPDGSIRLKQVRFMLQDRANKIIILSITDITDIYEQMRENRRLHALADKDSLTELYNKSYFYKKAEELLKQPGMKWLFFIDVDNFKSVNDMLGHLTGDHVLQDVASVLNSVFSSENIAARFGGDEFIALLPDAEEETARETAGNICSALHLRYGAGSTEIDLSVSVGVVGTTEALPVNELIGMADEALYSAKNKGKDQFAFYRK